MGEVVLLDPIAIARYDVLGLASGNTVSRQEHESHMSAWQEAKLRHEGTASPEELRAQRQQKEALQSQADQLGSFIEIPRGLGAEAPYRVPAFFVGAEQAQEHLESLCSVTGASSESAGLVLIVADIEGRLSVRHASYYSDLRAGIDFSCEKLNELPKSERGLLTLKKLGLENCVGPLTVMHQIGLKCLGWSMSARYGVAFLPDDPLILDALGTPGAPVNTEVLVERVRALAKPGLELQKMRVVEFTDGSSVLESGPASPSQYYLDDHRFA